MEGFWLRRFFFADKGFFAEGDFSAEEDFLLRGSFLLRGILLESYFSFLSSALTCFDWSGFNYQNLIAATKV